MTDNPTTHGGPSILLARAEQHSRGQEILAYAAYLCGRNAGIRESEAILAACALDAAMDRPNRVSKPGKTLTRTQPVR